LAQAYVEIAFIIFGEYEMYRKRVSKRRNGNRGNIDFGSVPDDQSLPFISLWIYRILLHLGGFKRFVNKNEFASDDIAEMIGLGEFIDTEEGNGFSKREIRKTCNDNYAQLSDELKKTALPGYLQNSIDEISQLVGLNSIEKYILGFTTLLHTERILEEACRLLGDLTISKTYSALSILLQIPEQDIKQALGAKSALYMSGLLKLGEYARNLDDRLELFSERFADAVIEGESDPVELFRETVARSSTPTLDLEHYDHIQKNIDILLPLLTQSVTNNMPGVNIYIYGPAGTGKTQLAKVVAHKLKLELFEIACEDEDGDPINGEKRLRSYSAAQSFLKNRKALLLFDEVEDVFNDSNGPALFGGKSTAQKRKAWMNRSLEENIIPTIWLSNTRHGLDPAFIRRYSMVFELGIPPKEQRKKVLTQYAKDIIQEQTIDALSESEDLAPAVVANAANVAHMLKDTLAPGSYDETFARLVNQTLEAQDYKAIKLKPQNDKRQPYSTEYLNTDICIDELITGLEHNQSARLCFYGPPGTGKTELGKHIAKTLNKPIISKKVSDLQSRWLGGTEQNIAEAFKQASEQGAVLIIDEVDSFLQDRTNAKQSWEQTQVNEMLTQMESFDGIFIASTNLMNNLDPASIRRFDAKIHFDYLNQDQLIGMVQSFCKIYLPKDKLNNLSNHLIQLRTITPGDFALVTRQINFQPLVNLKDLIKRLMDEQSLKGIKSTKIGFM
jgi:SpoVK/Ycf46/Vps4 family AAA+-type ATPase